MSKRTCSIEGCLDPVAGRGWCGMHYQRFQSNGDPLVAKRRFRQALVCEEPDCGEPGYMKGLCLSHYRAWQKSQRGPCSVVDCGEPWAARGLCAVHYHRFVRTGSTDDPKKVGRPCKVEGCGERARARDMCSAHYGNWRKYGSPFAPPRPVRVERPCSRDGCATMARRRNGMCERHYRETMAAGKPRCTMPGCTAPAHREGACEGHGGWSRQLFNRYGITAEQYNALLVAQHGCCAICRRPPMAAGRMKRLVVDHDHACCPGGKSCGKCVRGLLCHWCNRVLGLARDDPARLLAAIAYLEHTGTVEKVTAMPRKRRKQQPQPLAEVISLW
jgi:hypothetical protein